MSTTWCLLYDLSEYSDITLIALQLSIQSFKRYVTFQKVFCFTNENNISNLINCDINLLNGDLITSIEYLLQQNYNLIFLNPFTGLIGKLFLDTNAIGIYYNCSINKNSILIPTSHIYICNELRRQYSELLLIQTCQSELFEKAFTNIYNKNLFKFYCLSNIITYPVNQLAINLLTDISTLKIDQISCLLEQKKIINSNYYDLNNLIIYSPLIQEYCDIFYPCFDLDKSKLDGNIYSRFFKRYNSKKIGYNLKIEELTTKKIPDIIHCLNMQNKYIRAIKRAVNSSYRVYDWSNTLLFDELMGLNGRSENLVRDLYNSTDNLKLKSLILKMAILDKYGGLLIDGDCYFINYVPELITNSEFFMFYEDEYFCGIELNTRIFGCKPGHFLYNNYFSNICNFINMVFCDTRVVIYPSYYVKANKDGLPHCLAKNQFIILLEKNSDFYVANYYDKPVNNIITTSNPKIEELLEF